MTKKLSNLNWLITPKRISSSSRTFETSEIYAKILEYYYYMLLISFFEILIINKAFAFEILINLLATSNFLDVERNTLLIENYIFPMYKDYIKNTLKWEVGFCFTTLIANFI